MESSSCGDDQCTETYICTMQYTNRIASDICIFFSIPTNMYIKISVDEHLRKHPVCRNLYAYMTMQSVVRIHHNVYCTAQSGKNSMSTVQAEAPISSQYRK